MQQEIKTRKTKRIAVYIIAIVYGITAIIPAAIIPIRMPWGAIITVLSVVSVAGAVILTLAIFGLLAELTDRIRKKVHTPIFVLCSALFAIPILTLIIAFISMSDFIAGELYLSHRLFIVEFWVLFSASITATIAVWILTIFSEIKTNKIEQIQKQKLEAFYDDMNFKAQTQVVYNCVDNAIKDWVQEQNLTETYPLEGLEYLVPPLVDTITKALAQNELLQTSALAKDLRKKIIEAGFDSYETFSKDFSFKVCQTVSNNIITNIRKELSPDTTVSLPEHLRDIT